ncbi:MAG: hypothetical protein GY913_31355 [Proteobacteria bacterium]|nr:hypothetical protein [Pseudomonadota bacterium]MCP4921417.1 hypothetical protein [Pseudomonadota bacterium]
MALKHWEELAFGDTDVSEIGGKGMGLVRLARLDLPVPPFFVLTADEYRKSGRFPKKLRPLLEDALKRLGPGPYAVRSSAVAEDGVQFSFAGQLESVLGPDELDDVISGISTCWKSGNSARVQAYCAEAGIEPGPVAVVVQRLVGGTASGVLFTGTPEDPDRVLISAAWGVGEGVVQGLVPCDTFRVSADGTIDSEIDDKDEAWRVGEGVVTVPLDQRAIPCLHDGLVRRVAAMGRRLEDEQGAPQDIEFTVDHNELFVVQVRPITVRIPRGKRLLWDNSNIVESYNGVTTPMTYSFAKHAYTIIYQLFCRVMGVDDATIRQNSQLFHRMIGLVGGRVYYNLNAWYGVIAMLPGYQVNREFMEQMMGVAEVAGDEDAGAEAAGWQKALIWYPKLAWLGVKMVWRIGTLDHSVARFQALFKEAYTAHRKRNIDALSPFELLEMYQDLETRLLWEWTPPIVNDFFVMIFYGVLKKQCQKLTGDEETNLHNELLAGEGDLESTLPTIEALRLAQWLRMRPELVEVLASDIDDTEALAHLCDDPELVTQMDRYIRLYGDRCVDELKLETESLRHRPEFLVSILRNYLRGEPLDPDEFGASERRIRMGAEARFFQMVSGPKGWLLGWVLDQTRRRVKCREDLRFARTRIFGLVRDIVRAWGLRFVEAGVLDAREDVFYLTMDEVQGYIRGTTVTTNLRGLVALRRAEFEGHHAGSRPDERFHTRGIVHVDNAFRGPVQAALDADGNLVGTGCCPGVVEGPVVVLDDPRNGARLDGQILVAERTDPGWVPLYPSISGLLVERGSLLSHSAVVAREMGIPTIVGIRGLTERIQDGDVVRLDGGTGVVVVLSGEGANESDGPVAEAEE